MRSRQRTTVADVMTTAVVSVPPHAPVSEVASTLLVAAVRAVPVVGVEDDLLGVISEADLMATIAASEPVEHLWWRPRHVHRGVPVARPGARTAGELMSAVLVTIEPNATVAAAARLMREQGVNWLPVVADSRLVGVLGRSDLLAVFLRSDAAIRTEIVETFWSARWRPTRAGWRSTWLTAWSPSPDNWTPASTPRWPWR